MRPVRASRRREQLEGAIRIFLTRVATTRNKWIHELMLQEVSHPTPSFDLVLEQVLKPRMAYVREAIAGIIGCDRRRCPGRALRDERAVAAVRADEESDRDASRPASTHARSTPSTLARHIACFSIGGIQAIGSTSDQSA